MKAQYDAMYASEKKEKDEALAAALSAAPADRASQSLDDGADSRRSSVDAAEPSQKKKGLLGGFSIGISAPQLCESNYDCERPQVCAPTFRSSRGLSCAAAA